MYISVTGYKFGQLLCSQTKITVEPVLNIPSVILLSTFKTQIISLLDTRYIPTDPRCQVELTFEFSHMIVESHIFLKYQGLHTKINFVYRKQILSYSWRLVELSFVPWPTQENYSDSSNPASEVQVLSTQEFLILASTRLFGVKINLLPTYYPFFTHLIIQYLRSKTGCLIVLLDY